ncbi:MAG: class I SAM-dependent methyltransferase [Herpetosiphon sp.]|nr:class I SAM-dependent methyltransferase [Herpetosiphon sp.]
MPTKIHPVKLWAGRFVNRQLRQRGYEVKPYNPVELGYHQLWNDDAQFLPLYRQIVGYTLVDKVRSFMLYQWAKHAMSLDGDVAEIGVYKGGTARLLAKTLAVSGKTFHLFDTFAGMPPTDAERDLHQAGDFNDTSLQAVQKYLHDCPNVRFHQGFFPETATPITDTQFCFVHVDVDIYRSVLDCCAFFYPRLVHGGVMIFDDYGFFSCPGAKQAVDEFFADKPEYPVYLPTAQCMIVRQ